MSKVQEIITSKIVGMLEKGQIPWKRPWTGILPMNYVSGKTYQGINLLMLSFNPYSDPRYITVNQLKKYGGYIKKGEHGSQVVYWLFKDAKEVVQPDGSTKRHRQNGFPLYSTVFNVEQTTNWNPRQLEAHAEIKPIERCESLLANMPEKPEMIGSIDRAFYRPSTDQIGMPAKERFHSTEGYYAVLFHEMTHWTGSEKRLDRFKKGEANIFGSETYSKEELIAELGSAFICAECGIDNQETVENAAAYIQSWIKALKDDPKFIFSAASKAKKAVAWMKDEKEYEPDSEEPETATVAEPELVSV